MLAAAELQDLTRGVTWLPGWDLDVFVDKTEGTSVRITATVVSSYNPSCTVDLDIVSPLPPMETVTQYYDWLWWRLRRVLAHESDEWFKVKGEVWVNPHARSDVTRDGEPRG